MDRFSRPMLIPALLAAQLAATLVVILLLLVHGGRPPVQMVAVCDIGGQACVDITRPGAPGYLEGRNGIFVYPSSR